MVLKATLSVKSLEKLKQDLIAYRDSFADKTALFVKRLSEIGIPVIEENMAVAGITVDEDGIESGSNIEHNTYVKINSFSDYSVATLVLEGADILFIEFGSGVKYNGAVGTSPHPDGEKFGYLIGTYGKGNGAEETWGYYDETGALILSHGTKATMPMYKADTLIIMQIKRIAKEVFGGVDG